MNKTKVFLLSGLALFLFMGPALGFDYAVVRFPDSWESTAADINNNGTIVGTYRIGDCKRGFILQNGQYSSIQIDDCLTGWPGIVNATHLFGINNLGHMAGDDISIVAVGTSKGFYFDGAQNVMLQHPGQDTGGAANCEGTYVRGVNRTYQVTGFYCPTWNADTEKKKSFVHEDGVFTDIVYPGADKTQAWGVNDAGQVAGTAEMAGTGELVGFVWEDGTFSDILFPPFVEDFEVRGINNLGTVAGSYDGHGFLFANPTARDITPTDNYANFTTVDIPDAVTTDVYGINDTGGIVGSFTDAQGNTTGFVSPSSFSGSGNSGAGASGGGSSGSCFIRALN